MRTVIAFISNLDSLSTAHISAVGKAIASSEPDKASAMATAIAQQSQELSMVKFISMKCHSVHPPENIHHALQKGPRRRIYSQSAYTHHSYQGL